MKLLVVGQVDVIGEEQLSTRNRSLNLILAEYAKHFGEVMYFGPRRRGATSSPLSKVKFRYSSTFSPKFKDRLSYLSSTQIYDELDVILDEFQPDLIQVRVPGIFTIKAGIHLKKRHQERLFCYVAGNVVDSVGGNYSFPGSRVAAIAMSKWQDNLLRGLPIVTAGDALRNDIVDRLKNDNVFCHAYYSTTHNDLKWNEDRADEMLAIGRLERQKRPHLAVATLADLHARGRTSFRLRFLGEGPERKKTELLAKQLGVSQHVIFHGYERDSSKLREILLNAKFLVQPSMTEGTSKVLAEAMAHGVVPVAIRGVGSNDYILRDGVGMLVEPNSAAIADAIIELDSPARFQHKQTCGYQYASSHTLSEEVAGMFAAVRSFLEQPGAGLAS